MTKNCLQVTAMVLAGFVASQCRADVLYIPFSTGLSGNSLSPACNNFLANAYVSDGPSCWLQIPISIPVGRTIEQLTVFHSNGDVPFPFIEASLHIVGMSTNPTSEEVKFAWNSNVDLFNGDVARQPMMAQLPIKGGYVYPDQFPVVANTMYTLVVQLENKAAIEGLQVTYY